MAETPVTTMPAANTASAVVAEQPAMASASVPAGMSPPEIQRQMMAAAQVAEAKFRNTFVENHMAALAGDKFKLQMMETSPAAAGQTPTVTFNVSPLDANMVPADAAKNIQGSFGNIQGLSIIPASEAAPNNFQLVFPNSIDALYDTVVNRAIAMQPAQVAMEQPAAVMPSAANVAPVAATPATHTAGNTIPPEIAATSNALPLKANRSWVTGIEEQRAAAAITPKQH